MEVSLATVQLLTSLTPHWLPGGNLLGSSGRVGAPASCDREAVAQKVAECVSTNPPNHSPGRIIMFVVLVGFWLSGWFGHPAVWSGWNKPRQQSLLGLIWASLSLFGTR